MDLLFGFSGRIGRLQWWLAQLAILVILVVSVGIIAAFAQAGTSDGSEKWAAIANAGPSVVLFVARGLRAHGVDQYRLDGETLS